MSLDHIETARLSGERMGLCHADMLATMGANARVMATLGGVWSAAEAQEKLARHLREWAESGHGQWMFFLKESGALVGRGGIRRMMVNERDEIELGYVVLPEYWGQGFATEIGAKAVAIAFTVFNYPSVVAFTLVENKPSERVMQKLGFRFEATITHAGQAHVLYRRRNPTLATPAADPCA